MGQRPYRRYDVVQVDDCPVQPHVWREYGLRAQAGDEQDVPPPDPASLALELIAHVRDGVPPLIVLSNVRKWIPRRDGEQDTFVLYGQYFLVDATFEQMVTAILPLTGWSVLLRRIGEDVTDEDLALELRAARHPERGIVSEAVERLSQEDYGRLRWLLTQIVEFQPDMSSTALRDMVSRAIDRAPDGIGPLVSVGYNRWVEPSVEASRKTIKADAAESLFDVDCSGVHWAVVDTGIDDTHPCFGPLDRARPVTRHAHLRRASGDLGAAPAPRRQAVRRDRQRRRVGAVRRSCTRRRTRTARSASRQRRTITARTSPGSSPVRVRAQKTPTIGAGSVPR